MTTPIPTARIENRIRVIRGQKVMIDADLAELYGVETRVLNPAVKRNLDRFPADFMFQLSTEEFEQWRSQIVISNSGARMGLRRSPFDFTEYGAIQASNVLNSPRAIEVGVYVVRAFVQLREVLATHKNLAAKLARLERQTQALAMKHNTLAQNTRLQLKQVLEAIHELMAPPDPPKRPIAQSRHAAHRGDSHETTPTISGREGGLLSFTYSFQRKSMRALRVVQFNASLPLLALG